jgi:hypothetical protein
MPRTQFISGQNKASTRLTEQISNFTLVALKRLAIGLVIVGLIVIGLTNPSGAQMNRGARTENTPSSPEQQDANAALFARCLQDWDPGTHMTKKEWSGACQRLLNERGTIFPSGGNNLSRMDK